MRGANAEQATVTRFFNRRTPLRTRLSLNSCDVAEKGAPSRRAPALYRSGSSSTERDIGGNWQIGAVKRPGAKHSSRLVRGSAATS
jgi:hypothetical protein